MTMAPLPLDFRRHPTRRWRWVGWGLLGIWAGLSTFMVLRLGFVGWRALSGRWLVSGTG